MKNILYFSIFFLIMHARKLFIKYQKGRHWEKHPLIYAEKFAKFLKNKSFSGIILDVGCGTGRDVNIFSKYFNSMGIDYSEKEIKLAKKNFPKCKFVVQNAEKLKFKEKTISAIHCINVIHYLDENKAFKEFYRVLKTEGYIFIHFNLEIKDNKTGKLDYFKKEKDILKLISNFKIVNRKIFKRVDSIPRKHTHIILELILQKRRKTY